MKRFTAAVLSMFLLLTMAGCSPTMDDIIQNEPNITGVVTAVYEYSILIRCETIEGYIGPQDCTVSLDTQNKDSMTHFSVGDEVVVYYNGEIAEIYPLAIDHVYAITLRTPAAQGTE